MGRPIVPAAVLVAGSVSVAWAQTLPAGFIVETLANELETPTSCAVAPDGRVFISLKAGEVRLWRPDVGLLPDPFYTFAVDTRGERGLLGVALDPDFAHQPFLYAHYSRAAGHAGPDLARVAASTKNPDAADPASLQTLVSMSIYFISDARNGSAPHFGPDGKLYVGVGDNAVPSNAARLSSTFGKVLRFNADGSIPTDNPFYDSASGNGRAIWALGLRDPSSLAIHPLSGRMFLTERGETAWEEVNDVAPVADLGWPATEGDFDEGDFPGLTRPALVYSHAEGAPAGMDAAVGVFYTAASGSFPSDFQDDYLFADRGAGWIWRLDTGTGQLTAFVTDLPGVTDLDVDAEGCLLVLVRGAGDAPGRLLRVRAAGCAADFNRDGVLNSADFFDYLREFFENTPRADFNADGVVNSEDFFEFLRAFFAGC